LESEIRLNSSSGSSCKIDVVNGSSEDFYAFSAECNKISVKFENNISREMITDIISVIKKHDSGAFLLDVMRERWEKNV